MSYGICLSGKRINILTEIFENPVSWSKEMIIAVAFSGQGVFDQLHRHLSTLYIPNVKNHRTIEHGTVNSTKMLLDNFHSVKFGSFRVGPIKCCPIWTS